MSDSWPLAIMRRRGGEPPPAARVVRPVGVESAIDAFREAAKTGLRIVPLGGRSAVTGAIQAGPGDLGLDLTGLDRILEVDEHNLTVRVEAGVNGLALEEHLNSQDLTLGHFPSSLPVATVGGLISTRSSGQFSTAYGGIEDLVMGLKVLLPDGTVADVRPGPRSALGPALHELFIGAEGALGLILEAKLRVARSPAVTLGLGFDFPDIEGGLEAMRLIVQAGIRPLLLRLYDREDTAFQSSGADGGTDGLAADCLLVASVGGLPAIAAAGQAAVTDICLRCGGRELGAAPYQRWSARRFHLSQDRLFSSLEPAGSFLDTIEVAGPWDRLRGLHTAVKEHLATDALALCHFSHAYPQGCCAYFTFAGSAGSEEEARAAYRRCWQGAMEASLEHQATISHHHGTGQVRAPWVEREMGGWWEIWQRVRAALDTDGVMNPNAVGGHRSQPPS